MAQQPPMPDRPSLDLRGAVDLSSLAPRRPAAGAPGAANGNGAGAAGGGTYVIETGDTTFAADVMERSQVVPVILDLVSERAPSGRAVTSILEQLTDQLDGRILLAKIDVDANPQLVATLQVEGIPSVFAVLGGQLMVLFQGAIPPQEIQSHLSRLLQAASQYGVTGRLTPEDMGPAADTVAGAEPEEEPLPPLHQAAYDAIERDDLDAAIAAYEQALLEAPADDLARVGLAQVKLMARTKDADLDAARAAAAADPADVQAQILVADLDLLGGHVEDAFARLVDTVRLTTGDERDTVRAHLIELFEVVGAEDPRVPKARLALANALF